jgi:hypothetical protein
VFSSLVRIETQKPQTLLPAFFSKEYLRLSTPLSAGENRQGRNSRLVVFSRPDSPVSSDESDKRMLQISVNTAENKMNLTQSFIPGNGCVVDRTATFCPSMREFQFRFAANVRRSRDVQVQNADTIHDHKADVGAKLAPLDRRARRPTG